MFDILHDFETNIQKILSESDIHTMYIDYHKPFVSRIWMQYGKYRIYFHKIEPCKESIEALYHPHPWKSIIRILKGKYEMGVGYSQTIEVPTSICKLILPEHSVYEMIEEHGWHYVNPIGLPVYSVMITGEMYDRPMPIQPHKEFRELTRDEINDILSVILKYYKV